MKEPLGGLDKSGNISEKSLKKLNGNLLTHKQMLSEILKNPEVKAELKKYKMNCFEKCKKLARTDP